MDLQEYESSKHGDDFVQKRRTLVNELQGRIEWTIKVLEEQRFSLDGVDGQMFSAIRSSESIDASEHRSSHRPLDVH
jgi:hypothetical protein